MSLAKYDNLAILFAVLKVHCGKDVYTKYSTIFGWCTSSFYAIAHYVSRKIRLGVEYEVIGLR